MTRWLKRLAFLIWPPYEAALASRSLPTSLVDASARYRQIEDAVREALPTTDPAGLRKDIERLHESEKKRKETIEAKATTYLVGIGIAGGLVAAFPTLFDETWRLPSVLTVLVGVFHLLAVLHLFAGAVHAIQARRVAGFAMPSVDQVLDRASRPAEIEMNDLRTFLIESRFNEPILIKKMNHLAIAETMFLRGLVLVSVAAIALGVGKILVVLG